MWGPRYTFGLGDSVRTGKTTWTYRTDVGERALCKYQ
jgi:hypothetical protein